MAKNKDLDHVKVSIPRELKAQFVAKVQKNARTQAGVLKSLIHAYVHENKKST